MIAIERVVGALLLAGAVAGVLTFPRLRRRTATPSLPRLPHPLPPRSRL